MVYLANPTNTIQILKKYNFNFQKRYGQNFLIDNNVLQKIVSFAEIKKEDCVLEIGPGIGTMTQYLAERAKKVIAVEIDKELIPILKDTLSDYENVIIMNEDILKTDIGLIIKKENDGKPVKIVANLPYYITTPIIMKLFESHIPLENITIMVQKEVADRMQAKPGGKDYGALSLAVQYYSKPEVVLQVSPSCFMPKPNVGSSVVRLTGYEKKPVEVQNEIFMFQIIRAAFNQRRKTFVNSIGNAQNLNITKEKATEILKKMNINSSVRGEVLTLNQFAVFSDIAAGEK